LLSLTALLLTLGSLSLTSCEEAQLFGPSNTDEDTTGLRTDAGFNIFATGEVGHTSFFIRFDSDISFSQGHWEHDNLAYTRDTLEVTIVSKAGNTLTVAERYTPGSETFLKAQDTPNIPVESSFRVTPTDKGWIIEPLAGEKQAISLLFGFFQAFELPKQTKGDFEHIEQWKEKFDLKILGNSFTSVSLSYNYGPMAYDGAGLQWFYTDAKELVRIGFIGAMIPQGSGWDWLPQ